MKKLTTVLVLLSVVGDGPGCREGHHQTAGGKQGLRSHHTTSRGKKDMLAVAFLLQDADPRLSELCELRRLRGLSLSGPNVTDAGMRTVGGLTKLKRSGCFMKTAVTDAGLKQLNGLRDLEVSLYFTNTHVTDAGLKDLAEFGASWEDLIPDGTVVTSAGLKAVGRNAD